MPAKKVVYVRSSSFRPEDLPGLLLDRTACSGQQPMIVGLAHGGRATEVLTAADPAALLTHEAITALSVGKGFALTDCVPVRVRGVVRGMLLQLATGADQVEDIDADPLALLALSECRGRDAVMLRSPDDAVGVGQTLYVFDKTTFAIDLDTLGFSSIGVVTGRVGYETLALVASQRGKGANRIRMIDVNAALSVQTQYTGQVHGRAETDGNWRSLAIAGVQEVTSVLAHCPFNRLVLNVMLDKRTPGVAVIILDQMPSPTARWFTPNLRVPIPRGLRLRGMTETGNTRVMVVDASKRVHGKDGAVVNRGLNFLTRARFVAIFGEQLTDVLFGVQSVSKGDGEPVFVGQRGDGRSSAPTPPPAAGLRLDDPRAG